MIGVLRSVDQFGKLDIVMVVQFAFIVKITYVDVIMICQLDDGERHE